MSSRIHSRIIHTTPLLVATLLFLAATASGAAEARRVAGADRVEPPPAIELVERIRGKIDDPGLAVDARGRLTAVWERDDDDADETLWASIGAAGHWSTPEPLEIAQGHSGSPSLAVDSRGRVLVLWVQEQGRSRNVWSVLRDPRAGWALPAQVEFRDGDAYGPQVRFDASDRAFAVWAQSDGNRVGIWANRYTPEHGWESPVPLEHRPGDAYRPRLALDARGNALAVWHQVRTGTVRDIVASRYTAGSGWQPPEVIDAAAGDAYAPRLAMTANGEAMVVWEQSVEDAESIFARRYARDTGWQPVERIEAAGNEGYAPRVAMDGAGNAIALWVREQHERGRIWSNRYVAGKGWLTPTRVQTQLAQYTFAPDLAMSEAGNAVAVWIQTDISRNNVWASTFRRGSGWRASERVERRSGEAFAPRVVAAPDGRFHVLWKMVDGIIPETAIYSLWYRVLF